ncbi:hypothetical protein HDE_01827 [Halotydeus destructor]|nr:hypothetical protein HDE_01827 [Halotydeus destructor]
MLGITVLSFVTLLSLCAVTKCDFQPEVAPHVDYIHMKGLIDKLKNVKDLDGTLHSPKLYENYIDHSVDAVPKGHGGNGEDITRDYREASLQERDKGREYHEVIDHVHDKKSDKPVDDGEVEKPEEEEKDDEEEEEEDKKDDHDDKAEEDGEEEPEKDAKEEEEEDEEEDQKDKAEKGKDEEEEDEG